MNYELRIMNYRPVNDGRPGGIVIVIMNYRPVAVGDDMLLWGVMLVSVVAD